MVIWFSKTDLEQTQSRLRLCGSYSWSRIMNKLIRKAFLYQINKINKTHLFFFQLNWTFSNHFTSSLLLFWMLPTRGVADINVPDAVQWQRVTFIYCAGFSPTTDYLFAFLMSIICAFCPTIKPSKCSNWISQSRNKIMK